MTVLLPLHDEVDARVIHIRTNFLDWPCAKGCDSCCRHLAEVPQLTTIEWDFLRKELEALPLEQLQEICRNLASLPEQHAGPVVCPMLNRKTGACPVYANRPVACRTYGFFVQREKGLYCSEIESHVAGGDLTEVVWGNHDAIDQKLSGLGEICSLTEWFELWDAGK